MIKRLLTQISQEDTTSKQGGSVMSGNDYSEYDAANRSKSMSPSPNKLKNILTDIQVRTVFRKRGELSQSPERMNTSLNSESDNSLQRNDTLRKESKLQLLKRRLTSVRSQKSISKISKQESASYRELPEFSNNRRAQLLQEIDGSYRSNTVQIS